MSFEELNNGLKNTTADFSPHQFSVTESVAQQSDIKTVPEDQWRKFHPVTPVAYLGSFWIILIAFIFSGISSLAEEEGVMEGLMRLFSDEAGYYWFIFIAIALVVSIAIVFISWLLWRKMSYALLADGVHHRTGIIFKKHRQVRWDRIQTVEVEQKLFGRIFGFGSVKIDSAGTENVELGLLRLAECGALRAEILRVLNLARTGESFTVNYNPDLNQQQTVQLNGELPADIGSFSTVGNSLVTDELSGQSIGMQSIPVLDADDIENDRLVYELGFGRLFVASLTSGKFWILLLIVFPSVISLFTALEAGIFTSLIAVIGIVVSLVSSLLSDFGTRIYLSENGLRRRAGLTRLTTRTFPPARVHAIEISQQLLWRRWDWWSIKITVAGLNVLSDANQGSLNNFILAGKREEVMRLLWMMIPNLGVENNREFLKEAFEGLDSGKYFQGSPKSARIFDPVSLRGRGFFASEQVVVIRKGRFARSVAFILQDHTQSLSLETGPFKRRRGLVDISFHTVMGDVTTTAKHLDLEQMQSFFWEEVKLSTQARNEGISETLQVWRERVGV
ncbi:MAG: PH domain-containing protein [Arcanobacterium sp.]|nr:PH domain-containing protein [Arcanobacterium sp.]